MKSKCLWMEQQVEGGISDLLLAFDACKERMQAVKTLVNYLQPHEREVLRDWLTTPNPT